MIGLGYPPGTLGSSQLARGAEANYVTVRGGSGVRRSTAVILGPKCPPYPMVPILFSLTAVTEANLGHAAPLPHYLPTKPQHSGVI